MPDHEPVVVFVCFGGFSVKNKKQGHCKPIAIAYRRAVLSNPEVNIIVQFITILIFVSLQNINYSQLREKNLEHL